MGGQGGGVRILVTGSRTWTDAPAVHVALAEATAGHRGCVIVHGDCPRGADRIARDWARGNGHRHEPHPADWTKGRAAGHLRNSEMVALGADVVLAFVDTCETPGCPRRGQHFSHGTQDCVKKAAAAGIRVETYPQGALL